MDTDETLRKILYGNKQEFQEALQELDQTFEDGTAFRVLDEDEEYEFRMWAQANYVPGQPVSPIWHPTVQDECNLMNQGLKIDPEQTKKITGNYPKWYLGNYE